ncbi:hypothetical protein T07_9526 [Trichinella nelsoni]|uniref:Uncharacterized protein n=1 Tax=Trichinella nelsoni TaxID=6336 RepID=A0A0V0S0D3_9BILA|nr:hypothetical protein T07_9526 [Trichinella nelsoni]
MNFSHPLVETIRICGHFYDLVDHKDDRQQQQMRTWQLGFTCTCTHPSGSTGQPVNDIVVYWVAKVVDIDPLGSMGQYKGSIKD